MRKELTESEGSWSRQSRQAKSAIVHDSQASEPTRNHGHRRPVKPFFILKDRRRARRLCRIRLQKTNDEIARLDWF